MSKAFYFAAVLFATQNNLPYYGAAERPLRQKYIKGQILLGLARKTNLDVSSRFP